MMSEAEFKEYLDKIVRAAFLYGRDWQKKYGDYTGDINSKDYICAEEAIDNAKFEILEEGVFR